MKEEPRYLQRARIIWLVLQLGGIGWLSWALFQVVQTNYGEAWAITSVVLLLSWMVIAGVLYTTCMAKKEESNK